MKETIAALCHNKNFLMFITSIIYILGLFAYFNNALIIYSLVISVIAITCIIKECFPLKLLLVWVFMFYFGFFNAQLRMKNFDELYQIAPQPAMIEGQVVSIPNISKQDTLKFFFNVNKIRYDRKTYNIPHNKTLVSLRYNGEVDKMPLIGNSYVIDGKLSRPFTSTNPSQFSYRKYLRNFNIYTVCYSTENDYNLVPKELSLKWKLIQNLKMNMANMFL